MRKLKRRVVGIDRYQSGPHECKFRQTRITSHHQLVVPRRRRNPRSRQRKAQIAVVPRNTSGDDLRYFATSSQGAGTDDFAHGCIIGRKAQKKRLYIHGPLQWNRACNRLHQRLQDQARSGGLDE